MAASHLVDRFRWLVGIQDSFRRHWQVSDDHLRTRTRAARGTANTPNTINANDTKTLEEKYKQLADRLERMRASKNLYERMRKRKRKAENVATTLVWKDLLAFNGLTHEKGKNTGSIHWTPVPVHRR